MAARALLAPCLRQDLARDLAVVERKHVGADDLIGLVTLSGDDDRIAGLGPGEGPADRRSPVDLRRVAARRRPGPAHAGHHLVDYRLRPLRARIVGGHPHAVAEARGDLTHDRSLAPVAVAAAAEDDAEPAARELARGRQDALERIG